MVTRFAFAMFTLALLPVPVAASPAPLQDLGKVYPPTLDYVEGAVARTWTCDESDVWALRSFELSCYGELEIELGPSSVVFGKHDTNVVWAVVIPEKPAPLDARAKGNDEAIRCVFLRFNPARIAELFPKKTVRGHGPPLLVYEGKRVFAWKINAAWQSGNQPVIPWKPSIVVDVSTDAGRRFFMVDTDKSEVKYEPFFEQKPLPTSQPISKSDALAAFDQTWEAFDREYPTFVLKPEVDWSALRKTWRKSAEDARTSYEAAAAIAGMLQPLGDLHVWVSVGAEAVPMSYRERPLNASWKGAAAVVGGFTETKKDMVWARTEDGLGYVNVYELGDPGLPAVFDAALEQLADTWGMVVDLRFNGGGDELLARSVAGRFLPEPVVYSKNRYRSGPKHEELGPLLERVCEPRGPWCYAAPLVVLVGQRTMSSAESFALMLAQAPQATTMGDRTAGSSANPRRLELAGGIQVNLPRWLDLSPDEMPFENVGIAPEVALSFPPEAFHDAADPVLAAALERLREMPQSERGAGRR